MENKLNKQIKLSGEIKNLLINLLTIENHPIAMAEIKQMIHLMSNYQKYKEIEAYEEDINNYNLMEEEEQFRESQELYEEQEEKRHRETDAE